MCPKDNLSNSFSADKIIVSTRQLKNTPFGSPTLKFIRASGILTSPPSIIIKSFLSLITSLETFLGWVMSYIIAPYLRFLECIKADDDEVATITTPAEDILSNESDISFFNKSM